MKKKSILRKSKTDFNRIDALEDKDIDFSDCSEITPEMFAITVVRKGLKPVTRKSQITLRMDSDVLEGFKTQGRGYQTRMNALLRAYMKAQKNHQKRLIKK